MTEIVNAEIVPDLTDSQKLDYVFQFVSQLAEQMNVAMSSPQAQGILSMLGMG